MQQVFDNRKYSARDFEEWHEKNLLLLQPKFQRRDVWSDTAKSFLIDTILRGKPIPKLYMRIHINPKTRTTMREVVDGQQRIRTVLDFMGDGFKIRKVHNKEFGGRYFSELDEQTQKDILGYEFSLDLLHDLPDSEIYDIFARLNTYSVKLNPQELRNANWHGEFKTMAYDLSRTFTTFWETNQVFKERQMLRMDEVQFTSELLTAAISGISEGSKARIDRQYRDYDAEGSISHKDKLEADYSRCIDTIGNIFDQTMPVSAFKATRLFYPLFCCVYHGIAGLPGTVIKRPIFTTTKYVRIRTALEDISNLIEKLKAAGGQESEWSKFQTKEEIAFYKAFSEHWVHAEQRRKLFAFILKRIEKAVG